MADPDGWADVSPNGVSAPDAPSWMTEVEAESPARRSPQVREAQRLGSRRPDLLPKAPSSR